MGKLKANGFVIFANEYKKTHNVQYYNYRELLDIVSPFWNELPETEKERYKERAKVNVKCQELKRPGTSSIEDVQEKKLKLIDEEEIKRQTIEDLVYTANDLGLLDDKIFYFVNVSTFFEDVSDIYPAELAIAKYSLRKGIIDTLHIKINPGQLPTGAAFLAQDKANQTHKYLLPIDDNQETDYDFGESSYTLILLKIIDFIDPIEDEPIDDLPLFFTEKSSVTDCNNLRNVQKAFVRIFEKAGEYDIASELKLYSVVDLLYYLNKVTDTSDINPEDKKEIFASYTTADEAFRRADHVFGYIAQGCDFHEEMDVMRGCCLSRVKCLGYIMSKYCVNTVKYPLIEGRHFPKNFHVEH